MSATQIRSNGGTFYEYTKASILSDIGLNNFHALAAEASGEIPTGSDTERDAQPLLTQADKSKKWLCFVESTLGMASRTFRDGTVEVLSIGESIFSSSARVIEKIANEVESNNEKSDAIHEPLTDASSTQLDLPIWKRELGELTFRGLTAKRIRQLGQATNVVRILSAFQEDEWAGRIDSPFPDDESGKQLLRETLRSLNKNLVHIRFEADGTGGGVLWKRTDIT